jgi:hypothetical protein
MNFWLEYVHRKHRGQGYRMSTQSSAALDREAPDELLGRRLVDDSNWITSSVEYMTQVVESCFTFVDFHTPSFNMAKCEYVAVNKQANPVLEDSLKNPP